MLSDGLNHYKFNNKEEYQSVLSTIWDGQENTKPFLDNPVFVPIKLESATYNEQGEVLTPPVYDPCCYVDFAWLNEQPAEFEEHRVFPKQPKHVIA